MSNAVILKGINAIEVVLTMMVASRLKFKTAYVLSTFHILELI